MNTTVKDRITIALMLEFASDYNNISTADLEIGFEDFLKDFEGVTSLIRTQLSE